jgi:hypothetical protein
MNSLRLQRNLQFLYEDQLARIELRSFGCLDFVRDEDDAWHIRTTLNGNLRDLHGRSAYVGAIDGQPTVYAQLIQPQYQGGRFNRTRSVNQFLTHWIYPYRGKFHPQLVRSLLNILQVKRGQVVLEPYLGSGTTALETSLLGAECIGIDLSPLCATLGRVKTSSVLDLAVIEDAVAQILKRTDLTVDRLRAPRGASQRLVEFIEIARMVTYSDAARRGRDASVYLRRNLAAMLASVQAHATALKEFAITPGTVDLRVGDCRDRAASGIRPNSIDAVVTSPPYSIALDYVKNDEHALVAMDVDTADLRQSMTGVRGRGPKQKLELYNEDIQLMFREVARVLKPGAGAAFVVGDATVDGREYTTTRTMTKWAVDAGLQLERDIPKIVFGLYNVMMDEHILVFRKP